MTFFICLLCLVAGIAIGVGFTQVICTGMVNDTNKMWLKALEELDMLETQEIDSDVQVFENVTVIANGDDIQWYRQDNTVEIKYEEWEKRKEVEQNKENS